jgi:hypothetical protein
MSKAAHKYAIKVFTSLYELPVPPEINSVLYGNFSKPKDLIHFVTDKKVFETILMMVNKFADPKFNTKVQQAFGLLHRNFFNQITLASTMISDDHLVWYYDPAYGNCWKVNSGRRSDGSNIDLLEQEIDGYNQAIASVNFLNVFANQTYNFFNEFGKNSIGLKIFIDDQNAVPLHNRNLIPAKPGSCTYIGLKKIVTKNLPRPFTDCQDLTNFHSILYDKIIRANMTYSQQACLRVCMQKKMIDACNCSLVYFPNLDEFTTCQTPTQIDCFRKEYPINITGCDKWCPLECETLKYEYSISSDSFPDELNLKLLRADYMIDYWFQNANLSLENASPETIANSVACVYVYFPDLYTTKIVQTPAMTKVCF